MQDVTFIGIGLDKHSFHVHGQDRNGKGLLRKKFSRKELTEYFANLQPCIVVMEACACAHYMARQLVRFGHDKLISSTIRPSLRQEQ